MLRPFIARSADGCPFVLTFRLLKMIVVEVSFRIHFLSRSSAKSHDFAQLLIHSEGKLLLRF